MKDAQLNKVSPLLLLGRLELAAPPKSMVLPLRLSPSLVAHPEQMGLIPITSLLVKMSVINTLDLGPIRCMVSEHT